jgi:hypothetical protein
MWNVAFYDDETNTAYRIACKRLTIRDGALVDGDTDALTQDYDGRLLLALRRWPLMRYATKQAQRALLADAPLYDERGIPLIPSDAPWEEFELTLDAFQDLGEIIALLWYQAALQANPHRDASYELLKKNVRPEMPTPTSDSTTSAPPPTASSSAPTSSGA